MWLVKIGICLFFITFQVIFGELFQLPMPPHIDVMYTTLLIELCKLQPGSLPQVVSFALKTVCSILFINARRVFSTICRLLIVPIFIKSLYLRVLVLIWTTNASPLFIVIIQRGIDSGKGCSKSMHLLPGCRQLLSRGVWRP